MEKVRIMIPANLINELGQLTDNAITYEVTQAIVHYIEHRKDANEHDTVKK